MKERREQRFYFRFLGLGSTSSSVRHFRFYVSDVVIALQRTARGSGSWGSSIRVGLFSSISPGC